MSPIEDLKIAYRGLGSSGFQDIRILLLEGVHESAMKLFQSAGFHVDNQSGALSEGDLMSTLKVGRYNILGVRSKSSISSYCLKESDDLIAIGCFCIGTDKVELQTALSLGIAVFNSPFSNSRSVAELVLCEIIALSRQLAQRLLELRSQNVWKKSATGCFEVRGKTLGIIGYGHIGSQLSILAEAIGMHVIYHDIVCVMAIGGAVRAASLSSLLRNSDFVSLHVPSTPETVGMIGPDELAKMKSSAHIINASRGNVIDLLALKQALESGSISGAAIDVFPSEPKVNGPWNDSIFTLVEETTHKHDNKSNSSPLNLILTPHIGGSTEEAQRAIGAEVASAIIGYVNNGSTIGCVNFPEINLFAQSEMKNTRGGSFLASPSLVNESGMLTKSPVKLTRTLSWEFLGKQTEKVNDKSPQIACRVLNIHHNTPGVLCHVNDALKMFNIAKQTCESLGPFSYLAMDLIIEDEKSVKVIYDLISQIPASIKTRVIF